MLSRYAIEDCYLQFYNKFIQPIKHQIDAGEFNKKPTAAINVDTYLKWLGFAFERFCRRYHFVIANILGFSGVRYRSGTYFNRGTAREDPNFQIDLLFDRDDNVITLCEIRYTKTPVSLSVINDFENKLENFKNPKNKTIHRVLIASNGITESLKDQGYFDQVITLDDIFNTEQ